MNSQDLENINVTSFDAMPSPEELHARLPLSESAAQVVDAGREALKKHSRSTR
ncbi:hypothetical protein [Deefgea sp. CFH1-16]|uniref:hypothetical protein n=1 Tax=Deefgea sp. CFH1-16 TaxID=2675457 RepID=UPI001FFCAF15|nr:hypothetical protein [Deefgea sp. CFH1-16]